MRRFVLPRLPAPRRLSRRDLASRWIQCAFLALLCASLSVGLGAVGFRWSQFLDSTGIDIGFALRAANDPLDVAEKLPQSRDIVIVELPAETPRHLLARLVEKTHLARGVGLDLMFADPGGSLNPDEKQLFGSELAQWNRETNALATAIKKADNVVVGAWSDRVYHPVPGKPGMVESHLGWVLPQKSLRDAARVHAHLGVVPDVQDGIIRRVHLWENIPLQEDRNGVLPDETEPVPALGLALASRATGEDALSLSQKIPRMGDGSMVINYLGTRRVWEFETNRIVLERALNWAEAEDFRGKTVLVGQTDYRSKDTFPTPFGDMPGLFIHANIVATLLQPASVPKLLPIPLIFGISLLFGLALIVPILRFPLWICGVFAFALAILVVPLSAFCFVRAHTILPISAPLGALFLTYNAVALYEYARARRTLHRVVGGQMGAQLLNSLEGPRLGGKEVVATAFFCDLRGYSGLSQSLEPETLLSLLNLYTTAVTDEIQKWGGRPIDFFGDGVFALFEGEQDGVNHATRAVLAAIGVQNAINAQFLELRREAFAQPSLAAATRQRLRAGIAIHTGPMMVGFVGSQTHLKPGAVGDTVNVASRLQGLSDALGYSVLLTRATHALLRLGETLEVMPCGEFALKGRAGRMEVFGAGEAFPPNAEEMRRVSLANDSFEQRYTPDLASRVEVP